jgi:hypothetical protein
MLQKRGVSPAPATKPSKRAEMKAVAEHMSDVAERGGVRHDRLADLSSECLADLTASSRHLRAVTINYERAWDKFERILKSAKLESERANEARQLLFAVMFAGVVTLAGPEAMIGAWLKHLASLKKDVGRAKKWITYAGFVLSEPVEAGLGGAAEKGLQQATGSDRPEAYDARRGGASAGQRHKEALYNLSRLIEALPDLNPLIKEQHHVAMAAQMLANDASSVAAGRTAKWSAGEIDSRAERLTAFDVEGETDVAIAMLLRQAVRTIAAEVQSIKAASAREVEQRLWTNWTASLEGDEDDALSNPVIFNYLGLDFEYGDHLSALEEGHAVANARKKVLRERGINLSDAEDHGVAGRWQGEKELASLKPKVVGQEGKVIGRKGAAEVEVGGVRYSVSYGMRLVLTPGSRVRVRDMEVSPVRRTATLERWTGTDFEVAVDVLDGARP